ncbi:MAG: TRAP transporter small permease [Clostridium sp.]|nr:TRAP transporter small permease [Clostridium sp.]
MKKIIDRTLNGAIVILLGCMAVVCCWQVFTRYVLGNPSKVTEEFLRYSLIWLTMLGSPYAYGLNKHLSINFFTKTFDEKHEKIVNVFVEIVVIFLSVFVLICGGILVCVNSIGQTSAAMHLPMQFLYMGLPISGVLTVYYSALKLKAVFSGEKLQKTTEKTESYKETVA